MNKDFSEIVYMAQKFQNDLKHIKLHASGIQYDTIVSICDKLIKELDEEIEDFSKWSFENGCPVDNPSNLRSHLLADPIDGEVYDFTDFIEYLNGSLLDYIEEIDSFEEGWMAGYSHFWTRELKDNEMRRFVKNEGPVLSPEEQEDYSAALAPYMVNPPENDTEFNKPLPPVDWSAMDFVNNTQNVDEDLDENTEETQEQDNESESEDEEQESLNESKMSDEEKSRLDKSVNLNGWTEKDEDDDEENEERKRIEAAEEDEEFKDATL